MLHGKAGDGALMRRVLELTGWLAELRAHSFEVEFLDAPHAVSPAPELFASLAAAGEYNRASYFGWESATVDEAGRAAAVCESVQHVERWIEQHASISGICGISDGALIAAAVVARSPSLQFFINFCSTPWERLPTSMDLEVPQLITVPSLHVLGRADELLSSEQLWSVPSRCENMTTLWHKGGHVVPLLDDAATTALQRFLGAGAGANSLPQEGTPPVLQQPPRQAPSHDTVSTATRILAELKGSPVESDMPLASLGLNSVQVIQFRSQLCEALHITIESLPLSMLMQGVGDGSSIAEIVAALRGTAPDQGRSEPEATVPELPSKESHETSLVWACTLCACILQPITFLVRILSFWTPLASACAIDYAIFGSASLFDAKASHYGLGNLPLAFALVYSRLVISFVVTLICICLKWLLVGRLRPTDAPHRWPVLAQFRWRSGRIIHAQLEPALECFRGTAILTCILRALGARVHRSATIETTQIFDWDLVDLGPHSVLQEKASISAAHLHLSSIRFERVVVDALVGTGAHVSAGAHVLNPVAPSLVFLP